MVSLVALAYLKVFLFCMHLQAILRGLSNPISNGEWNASKLVVPRNRLSCPASLWNVHGLVDGFLQLHQ
jgi:hypothetical protein